MAVLKRIKCNVKINNKNIREYHCPRDHDASVANKDPVAEPVIDKYIESRPDRNFAITVHVPKRFDFSDRNGLEFDIYIDGTFTENRIVIEEHISADHGYTFCVEGPSRIIDGAAVLQKYRFSKLTTGKLMNPFA